MAATQPALAQALSDAGADGGRGRIALPTGTSAAIREVIGLIRRVAPFDSTVLILGESGTGKEVAARAIHELSPRRQRPFVAVNCGAIPADLLESELFGHVKGAFTGAVAARKGRFEVAAGGTLFLDEIGDMSPTMQVKLLRVLQERVFERVGEHEPRHCDVRILAATHRNLEESIGRGAFRADLFHRINVFPIEMPALRARIEDLPLLAHAFIAHNIAEGRGRVALSASAFAALSAYSWPGNVRELANLMERLSIVCGGRCAEISDLPVKYRPAGWTGDAISSRTSRPSWNFAETRAVVPLADPQGNASRGLPESGMDLRGHLRAIERQLVSEALDRSGGVVAHAARLLNLRRTTLIERLRRLGLESGPISRELATED